MTNRPTLLNSCASAATAAEARYRIDALRPAARATRVVALDAGAWAVVQRLAERSWGGARFFSYEAPATSNGQADVADIVLATEAGGTTRLSEELADADVMMMVATADDGAVAASVIGNACTLRGIMTAGLILGSGSAAGPAGAAVAALRPHARVLLVTDDVHDLSEVLAAIGA